MRIEKKITSYGYDLMINNVLYKRCLTCHVWYEFDGEMGCCTHCLKNMEEIKYMSL